MTSRCIIRCGKGVSFAPRVVPLVFWILLQGCGGGATRDAGDSARTPSYQPGTPGFDIETVQSQDDSVPAVDLYLSIPYPSLIFEKSPGGFRSRAEITVRLVDRSSQATACEISWGDTTETGTYEATQSSDPITLRKHFAVPAGSYRVEVTLEDLVDFRRGARTQSLDVVDPRGEGPSLGRISLLARQNDGTRIPRISFFVPLTADSAECSVTLFDLPREAVSRIALRALRFQADTLTAAPPYYYTVLQASAGRALIEFDRPDTVCLSAMYVRPARRALTVEFTIPPLRRGVCRLECFATLPVPGGRDTTLSAGRYYSVQGPGFPRPITYGELIDAAAYVATEQEMAVLRGARGAAEQRKRFEELWLKFGGDVQHAAALIRKYYARVEEANRLFTGAREGWRTDRGMLYCVLGPPAEVSNRLDTQTWYYDLSGIAADNAYSFKRIVRSGEGMNVEEYALYRAAGYEQFWERMVGKWRTGEQP